MIRTPNVYAEEDLMTKMHENEFQMQLLMKDLLPSIGASNA